MPGDVERDRDSVVDGKCDEVRRCGSCSCFLGEGVLEGEVVLEGKGDKAGDARFDIFEP